MKNYWILKLNRVFIFIGLFLFFATPSLAQEGNNENYYLFPIKPGQRNDLAGTMGELRSTHFHAGIDVTTRGAIGLPIYAAADGYISRIKVAEGGYGNALYMLHPNGTTTVYAHLNKYEEHIAAYVRQQQYKNESFTIELHPGPNDFKFKKGDIIAYSGNSGSSSGPHLHFEIRDKNQHVLNPMAYRFSEISDHNAPRVSKLALVPLDINARVNKAFQRVELTPTKSGNQYRINESIFATGWVGIELLTYDQQDGTNYRNGVQMIEMWLDDEPIFKQVINRFSFAETRNVLALTNYPVMIKQGSRFNKLYVDNGNTLSFYSQLKHKGKLNLKAGLHRIRIELTDTYNNKSQLELEITGEDLPIGNQVYSKNTNDDLPYEVHGSTLLFRAKVTKDQAPFATVYANRMQHEVTPAYYHNNHAVYLWNLNYALPDSTNICDEKNYFNFKATVPPKKAFHYFHKYMDISFTSRVLFDTLFLATDYFLKNDSTQEFFVIGDKTIPLKTNATFKFKPRLNYKNPSKYKAYILDQKNMPSYEGGDWSGKEFIVKSRSFGTYTLLKDDIKPTVKALTISSNSIRFQIDDELSGIKSYRLEVNGQWVLMNYNYKRKLLWSEKLDESQQFKGPIKLLVTDNCNNVKVYETSIQ